MTHGPEDQAAAAAAAAVRTHYGEDYWAYQQAMGDFGGWALAPNFASHVSSGDRVVDFGCGGGYLLKRLVCAERFGVEINEAARAIARSVNGITTVTAAADLPDAWADVVISNHALEHCAAPYGEISQLLRKLKPGGRFVCYVPHESNANKWSPGNVDNHLYTWNPMTLGNLFANAGYEVLDVRASYQTWPPYHTMIAKGGRWVFDLASRIYGTLDRRYSQVRIVARRPAAPV